MIRASSRAGRLVAFDLLEHPTEPVSARTVAKRTKLAFASVNDILRFFRFHGAITQGKPPTVRWRRLAELTSHLRLPDLVPARTAQSDLDAQKISHHLDEAGLPHVFAFTTAANRWAYFEPEKTIHVIIGPRQSHQATKALQTNTPGHTTTIHIYEDDLNALKTETLQSMPLTSRLQTWIDLNAFPHAGAHAAFFKQVIEKLYPEAHP